MPFQIHDLNFKCIPTQQKGKALILPFDFTVSYIICSQLLIETSSCQSMKVWPDKLWLHQFKVKVSILSIKSNTSNAAHVIHGRMNRKKAPYELVVTHRTQFYESKSDCREGVIMDALD